MRGIAGLLAAVAAVAVAATATAHAAARGPFAGVPDRQAAQATVLELEGAGWRALRAAGVELDGGGGARARGAHVTLPTGDLLAAGAARAAVEPRGTLRLRRGSRTVVLDGLRVGVARATTLSARLRGRRLTIVAVAGARPTIDPIAGIVRLAGGRARLTRAAAVALGRALGTEALSTAPLARVTVDVDAGSDLPAGGIVDWGLSDALRAAADAGVAAPDPAITVFDSAICAADARRRGGCRPDLPRDPAARRRSTIHFPVIDGRYDAARRRGSVEGQGALRIVHPPTAATITVESPRLDLAGRTVTLSAYLSVATGDPATSVAQRRLALARFTTTTAGPLRRGGALAWATGPGALTAQAAALLPAVAVDPMTFSIDAPRA